MKTLEDFLHLIIDEEASIELEISEPDKDDYIYVTFWFSDWMTNNKNYKYNKYKVKGISFLTESKHQVDITIQIEK